jgi:nitroimidazol reductase NimA-like FMN-containing flavoprotein (pyridoxamine 5'-phosphate oxidase superfamily)
MIFYSAAMVKTGDSYCGIINWGKDMSSNLREMRRKDRELPKDAALAVADNCAYSVMATVNPDGTPYCVPLSMAREGEWLYFHCAMEGHKIDNLKSRSQVCVSCVGEVKPVPGEFTITYESAIISGPASEVTDREEKIRALALISRRYTPANMAAFDDVIEKTIDRTAVWKIHIDEISGKANRGR